MLGRRRIRAVVRASRQDVAMKLISRDSAVEAVQREKHHVEMLRMQFAMLAIALSSVLVALAAVMVAAR